MADSASIVSFYINNGCKNLYVSVVFRGCENLPTHDENYLQTTKHQNKDFMEIPFLLPLFCNVCVCWGGGGGVMALRRLRGSQG